MKIINKTPHAVYIMDEKKSVLKMFPKSKGMIRVKEITKVVGNIENIPITTTNWLEANDVPPFQDGIYYIVSQLVKNALPERTDLLVPKGAIRDDEGNVIGCTHLDLGPQTLLKPLT